KAGGLVPAVAQDADSGEVLMLAWMNKEAFEETLRTGRACYFSRSRNKLWRKGEESGHVQEVRGVFVDCDADTILLKVKQVDRANVSVAKLQMVDPPRGDYGGGIGATESVIGFGFGVFFWGYWILEIPSTVSVLRWGARWVFVRILVLWGLVCTLIGSIGTPL